MKLYTTFLLALLAGLLVYAVRRRLRLAFTVVAIAYPLLLLIRLPLAGVDLLDRVDELALPLLVVAALWTVLTVVSTRVEQRRMRERAARRREEAARRPASRQSWRQRWRAR